MSEHVFFTTIGLLMLTVLLIFGMRFIVQTQAAQARIAEQAAFRQLAEKAGAAQADTALSLAGIQTTLADLGARLAAVEKILKDVE